MTVRSSKRIRYRPGSIIRASAPSIPGYSIDKRVKYVSATDDEALDAFHLLTRLEGIIPALEGRRMPSPMSRRSRAASVQGHHLMVINLSGRGDKDIATVMAALPAIAL